MEVDPEYDNIQDFLANEMVQPMKTVILIHHYHAKHYAVGYGIITIDPGDFILSDLINALHYSEWHIL